MVEQWKALHARPVDSNDNTFQEILDIPVIVENLGEAAGSTERREFNRKTIHSIDNSGISLIEPYDFGTERGNYKPEVVNVENIDDNCISDVGMLNGSGIISQTNEVYVEDSTNELTEVIEHRENQTEASGTNNNSFETLQFDSSASNVNSCRTSLQDKNTNYEDNSISSVDSYTAEHLLQTTPEVTEYSCQRVLSNMEESRGVSGTIEHVLDLTFLQANSTATSRSILDTTLHELELTAPVVTTTSTTYEPWVQPLDLTVPRVQQNEAEVNANIIPIDIDSLTVNLRQKFKIKN